VRERQAALDLFSGSEHGIHAAAAAPATAVGRTHAHTGPWLCATAAPAAVLPLALSLPGGLWAGLPFQPPVVLPPVAAIAAAAVYAAVPETASAVVPALAVQRRTLPSDRRPTPTPGPVLETDGEGRGGVPMMWVRLALAAPRNVTARPPALALGSGPPGSAQGLRRTALRGLGASTSLLLPLARLASPTEPSSATGADPEPPASARIASTAGTLADDDGSSTEALSSPPQGSLTAVPRARDDSLGRGAGGGAMGSALAPFRRGHRSTRSVSTLPQPAPAGGPTPAALAPATAAAAAAAAAAATPPETAATPLAVGDEAPGRTERAWTADAAAEAELALLGSPRAAALGGAVRAPRAGVALEMTASSSSADDTASWDGAVRSARSASPADADWRPLSTAPAGGLDRSAPVAQLFARIPVRVALSPSSF
jgi:hypothetical protein